MCTLIVLRDIVEGYPLILLMNRDEQYGRKATPPRVWPGPVPFVAPRDEKGGGTWCGVNERGLVVALSNREGGPEDLDRRSRGLLVTNCLGTSSRNEALALVEAERYNPFNLLLISAMGGVVLHHGEREGKESVGSGLHLMANGDLDDDGTPRLARAMSLLAGFPKHPRRALKLLRKVSADHGTGRGDGLCRHGGDRGTVSALLLALPSLSGGPLLYYAPGPPCSTPFDDYAGLLASVLRPPFRQDSQEA